MDNILNYPTSTHVDRLVPKTAFYKHLEINTRLKMRFVEDVERIQWLYKLAPSTMNVDEGKAVHEIVVFLVTLKVEDTLDDVFLAIDRQMPRYVVFVLQYANRSRLLLNYKEWADANKTRFNILKTFRTKWMPLAKVKLELAGSSLDNIYEAFAGQISGFGTTNATDTKQIMALQDELTRKRRAAEVLQKRVRNETQFAKQMELNSEARTLKREIAKLEEELKTLENNQEQYMADILKHLDLNSVDGTQLNLDALYQVVPSAFTEVRDDKTGKSPER